jgi:hypothetical protein
MAVRARMTPSHQSVEDVRRCVREAQAKGAGHGPQQPMSEFNEEVPPEGLSLATMLGAPPVTRPCECRSTAPPAWCWSARICSSINV